MAVNGAMGDASSRLSRTGSEDGDSVQLPQRLNELRNQLDYLRNVYNIDDVDVSVTFLLFKKTLPKL